MEIILEDLRNNNDIDEFRKTLTRFYEEIEHDILPDNDLDKKKI